MEQELKEKVQVQAACGFVKDDRYDSRSDTAGKDPR